MIELAAPPVAPPVATTTPRPVRPRVAPDSLSWIPLVLLIFVLLAAAYHLARTGGHWSETDSAAQALAIRTMIDSKVLVPEQGDPYANGFAYVVVSEALLAFTGLDIASLQQLVQPLLAVGLVLPAWALLREVLGTSRGAALAALLLFTQPELLFVVLRGSHERVLRTFMLVALWLLIRSFRFRHRPAYFALHVALFYLMAYGLVATNSFFGVSFLMAITCAMLFAWLLGRFRPNLRLLASTAAGRLALVSAAMTALGFLHIYYVYPPSSTGLRALNGIGQRLATMFLTTSSGSNPYAQVAAGWIDLPVYFLVSASDYLLLAGSALAWIWLGLRWIRGVEKPTQSVWLIFLLYAAFAFQGALTVVGDWTGELGGNLQHRSFPSFAMVAAPVVALALERWRPPRLLGGLAIFAAAAFAWLAILKATNEPGLSNKWTFYVPSELVGMRWIDEHQRYSFTWVGFDERLATAYAIAVGRPANNNTWDIYAVDPQSRTFLVSPLIQLQSSRLRQALRPLAGENLIYDSGAVQLYRLRSQNAFQP